MITVAPLLGKLAAALAEDTGPGRRAASEMVAAAALRSISAPRSEAALEHDLMKRTLQGLLSRARGADYTRGAENALFRLPAADRSALVLAHAAKWTYAEIGDAVGVDAVGAERLVWAARLGLAAEKAQIQGAKHWAYPIGASRAEASCPEYDTARPWTQRFLDGRFASRMEQIFFRKPCARVRELSPHATIGSSGVLRRRSLGFGIGS